MKIYIVRYDNGWPLEEGTWQHSTPGTQYYPIIPQTTWHDINHKVEIKIRTLFTGTLFPRVRAYE